MNTTNRTKELGVSFLYPALSEDTLRIAENPVGDDVENTLRLMANEMKAFTITVQPSGKRRIDGKASGPDDIANALMLGMAHREELCFYSQFHDIRNQGFADHWVLERGAPDIASARAY
jgi:hypothetical protein